MSDSSGKSAVSQLWESSVTLHSFTLGVNEGAVRTIKF